MNRSSWFIILVFSVHILACSKSKPLTSALKEASQQVPEVTGEWSISPTPAPSPSAQPTPSPSAIPTSCAARWSAPSFTYTVDHAGNAVAPFNAITLTIDYDQPVSANSTFQFSNAVGFFFIPTSTQASSDLKHLYTSGYFESATSPNVHSPIVTTNSSGMLISCAPPSLSVVKITLPPPTLNCSLQASTSSVQIDLGPNDAVITNPAVTFSLSSSSPITLNNFSGQTPYFQFSTSHPNINTYSMSGNFTGPYQSGDFVFSANVSGNGTSTTCSKTISVSVVRHVVSVYRLVLQETLPGSGALEIVDWFYNHHNIPGNGYQTPWTNPAFKLSRVSFGNWNVPVYKCFVSTGTPGVRHFLSTDGGCEGNTPDYFTNEAGQTTYVLGYGSSLGLSGSSGFTLNRYWRSLNYGNANVSTLLSMGAEEFNASGLSATYSLSGAITNVAR